MNFVDLSRLIWSLWPYIIGCKIWSLFALARCFLSYWRFHWKTWKIVFPSLFIIGNVILFWYLHLFVFLIFVTINNSNFFQFFFILFLTINAKIFIEFLFLNSYFFFFLKWIWNYITKFNNIWFLLQILQSHIQIEFFGIISRLYSASNILILSFLQIAF